MACVLFVLCAAGSAHAYQNVGRFAAATEKGGGGGRFFTGAPGDGYTCKVCHTGGMPPRLDISGLPIDGYAPGQSYVVTLDWADSLPLVALNLTITDRAGKPLGSVIGLPSEQLMDADLCATTKTPDLVAASSPERNLVYVAACGGQQATFQWTAPDAFAVQALGTAPDALFNGSLLVSNADNAVTGDDVTDFSRAIGLSGQSQPAAMKVAADCAVHCGASESGPVTGLVCGGLAALLVARRSSRRQSF